MSVELKESLRIALLELLDKEYDKTIEYLVEELRVEYPGHHQKIMQVYAEKYDLSGCGAHQSPLTAVNQVLSTLCEEGVVLKKTKNGITMWRLAG